VSWLHPSELTIREATILGLLARDVRDAYGLDLVKASDGRLRRGVVYVTLQRLEEQGLIESREETSTPVEIGIPRRLYRITGLGAQRLAEFEACVGIQRQGWAQ